VQLVQGRKKALEFDNFQEWVDRFRSILWYRSSTLDAAMGRGNNAELVRKLLINCSARWAAAFAHSRQWKHPGPRRATRDHRLIPDFTGGDQR